MKLERMADSIAMALDVNSVNPVISCIQYSIPVFTMIPEPPTIANLQNLIREGFKSHPYSEGRCNTGSP